MVENMIGERMRMRMIMKKKMLNPNDAWKGGEKSLPLS